MTYWMEARLDVARVDQRKKWFCGAACSEMILEHFALEIDQATAYEQIHDRERFKVERLYSDPQGIVDYLNAMNDSTEMIDVIDITSQNDSEVLDDIYRVLFAFQTPVALLALGGAHWVVVDGVRYRDDLDGRRQYAGFYIQNPWKGSTPSVWIEVDEFSSRWVQPNQFGQRWLGKIVLVATPRGRRKLSNLKLTRSELLPPTGERQAPKDVALKELAALGFENMQEISGGGALVLRPVEVLNEDDGTRFQIVPIDAVLNREFSDFVYVCINDGNQRVLEISGMSEQLDIPSDVEALERFNQVFPNEEITIDPDIYWRARLGAVSKTDVYRKARVNSDDFFLLRDGTILRELEINPSVGG
ncbi:cysteine peptidase family C39 domain-containing protein [Albidovulum salinarum]|nr:hypothetical protein [Defluviimonas sp. WL0024]